MPHGRRAGDGRTVRLRSAGRAWRLPVFRHGARPLKRRSRWERRKTDHLAQPSSPPSLAVRAQTPSARRKSPESICCRPPAVPRACPNAVRHDQSHQPNTTTMRCGIHDARDALGDDARHGRIGNPSDVLAESPASVAISTALVESSKMSTRGMLEQRARDAQNAAFCPPETPAPPWPRYPPSPPDAIE